MKAINTKQELIDFQKEFGLRADWHEPDEQDITAEVTGLEFDNAYGVSTTEWATLEPKYNEKLVVFRKNHEIVGAVNLANLCAWACETNPTA